MNGCERVKAALAGKKPDKIPIMLHNFLMAAKEAGFTQAQYRNNPKNIAETFIKSIEKYQYDGVLIDIDTATVAGAVGVPVDFPDDEPARYHVGCMKSLDDVDSLQIKDISKDRRVQIWLEATTLLADHFKGEIYIRGNCDQAAFSLASSMRSPEEWMVDLLTDEGKCMMLLDYTLEHCKQFIRLMAKTGADMVSNGDSPAGPAMISPEMYEKFALPSEQKIAAQAHECGLPHMLHICGNTDVILDKMLLCGSDALELDYKTDIEKINTLCKGRMVFSGNIDPSGILALGKPDDVRRKTEELLTIMEGNHRFILNAGCAIPSITPSANLKAMIDTARAW